MRGNFPEKKVLDVANIRKILKFAVWGDMDPKRGRNLELIILMPPRMEINLQETGGNIGSN